MSNLKRYIEEALARSRSRTSWNDRLTHWEKPPSKDEEDRIQRAARMVREIVYDNNWFRNEHISVYPQGSYFNNTNVRSEADMDVRIQHPDLKIIYSQDVDESQAGDALGYVTTDRSFESIMATMRQELERDLVRKFGVKNVDVSGNKAICVAGLDGSRVDCDIVPAFTLHYINEDRGSLIRTEGVAIFGRDRSWTYNFPEQHHSNGNDLPPS